MSQKIPRNAFAKKEDALRVLNELEKYRYGEVEKVVKKRKSEPPPLLHSLTTLQREANKEFGFSAQKTLEIAQKLYETYKVISYPRTDSQYLATSNKSLVKEILKKLGKEDLIPKVEKVGKRVFNDAKLTDHHAIIPLAPPPPNLSRDEKRVFDLIQKRFLGVFMPNYEYEITTVVIQVEKYKFGTKGKRDISLGWKSLHKEKETEIKLPALKKGDKVKLISVEIEKKFTQPPPRYTEASLLKIMEKFNLGTPATRSTIIENLLKRNYLIRKGKNLSITPKGKELIEKLKNSQITLSELTSKWENGLENIYRKKAGFKGYQYFIEKIKEFVKAEMENLKNVEFVAKAETAKIVKGDRVKRGKRKKKKKSSRGGHNYKG